MPRDVRGDRASAGYPQRDDSFVDHQAEGGRAGQRARGAAFQATQEVHADGTLTRAAALPIREEGAQLVDTVSASPQQTSVLPSRGRERRPK